SAQFNQLFGGLNAAGPLSSPPAATAPQGPAFPGAGSIPGATAPAASPFSNPFSVVQTGRGMSLPGRRLPNAVLTPGATPGGSGYSSNGPGVLPNGGLGTTTVPGAMGSPAPASPAPIPPG